jgi:galactokinase
MYTQLKAKFEEQFGRKAAYIFSAPGRTELGGNHTDHQHGKVLAAAVNREALAAVAENGTGTVNLLSEGYPMCRIDLNDLSIHPEEAGKTSALIRGVAAKFQEYGLKGFDAYVTSNVLSGSGLSSSAAFEVLIGVIFNRLCNAGKTPVEIAQIGQFAENVYFGKPCGLMDQTASSVGNIIGIDFQDPSVPIVTPIPFDFSSCGYQLCIIDSGASHADLTDEYAAITQELKAVCRFFGKEYLRDVSEEEFYENIAAVRKAAGDRAVLRAIHVFEENKRVEKQTAALLSGDFEAFLQLVTQSGYSSWLMLQNVVPAGRKENQEVAYSLAVAQQLLGGRGACRVHGGGFAGTIQAFVPGDMVDAFRSGMEKALGEGSCHIMAIRKEGGVLVEEC